ncbi:MAG: hypothetical protein EOO16_02710 [Chitinophagaceae bacterium]|nr:MAG: hypothetical protein EOO16_02710 [Chitinophagaceae bacterium]
MNNTPLRRIVGCTLILAIAASCGKKSSDTDAPATPSQDSATVRYVVTSSNRTGGLVNWTSARGAGKQVAFKANGTSRVEVYKYTFINADLYTTGYEVASVRVPAGSFTNVEFNYQMIPSRDPALQLVGTYTANGVSTPVKVNIDQFAEIATQLPTASFTGGTTYKALINLDLAAITNGITATNLNNAARTNNEIVIAYYSNPALLQTIINNINNVMRHSVTLSAD